MTLQCHECDAEAVGQCRICGKGFCGGHGADLCRGCATAIVAVEPGRAPAPRMQFLQCVSRPRMQTVYLDDDGPPECHRCQAYAKFICANCQNLFCAEHIGKNRWCEQCTRESNNSTLVALGIVAFFVFLIGCLGVLNFFKLW